MSRATKLDLDLPSSILRLLFETPPQGGMRFEAPWRFGLNAAWGIADYFKALHVAPHEPVPEEVHLVGLITRLHWEAVRAAGVHGWCGSISPIELYARAGDIIGLAHQIRYRDVAIAFGRAVQLYVARSDGGGFAYNDLLRQLEGSGDLREEAFDSSIREARALDAIGTRTMLQNDSFDPIRHAFTDLWQRRHYRLIYALPRASTTPTPLEAR